MSGVFSAVNYFRKKVWSHILFGVLNASLSNIQSTEWEPKIDFDLLIYVVYN